VKDAHNTQVKEAKTFLQSIKASQADKLAKEKEIALKHKQKQQAFMEQMKKT